jgi:hypothetical protein
MGVKGRTDPLQPSRLKIFPFTPLIIIIIIIIIIVRISHFSASAGKYSPILACIINRIRLGGPMCNLGNFLQLNMCQELPLFAFVCMCLGTGYYYYFYYYYYLTYLTDVFCVSPNFAPEHTHESTVWDMQSSGVSTRFPDMEHKVENSWRITCANYIPECKQNRMFYWLEKRQHILVFIRFYWSGVSGSNAPGAFHHEAAWEQAV